MSGVTQENIERWFDYHSPVNARQRQLYGNIREAAKAFATVILENTSSCPDQTVAIRRIREAVFNANEAIACEGELGGVKRSS